MGSPETDQKAPPKPTPTALAVVEKMSERFELATDTVDLLYTLKATAFRGVRDGVTDDDIAAFGLIANQYGLNPWTKEIHAFKGKDGAIVPVVGVDGWSRIINEHPQFDGVEFAYENDDQGALVAVTATIHRKDRAHATAVTEFMAECKRGTSPWQSHPRRMLRHKAMIQCARIAFGFVGIHDLDEVERIIDMGKAVVVDDEVTMPSARPEPEATPKPATQPAREAKPSPEPANDSDAEDIEFVETPAPKPAPKPSEQRQPRAESRDLVDRPASGGEKAWLSKRAGDGLEALLAEHKTTLDDLTLSQFSAMRSQLMGAK